LFSLADTIVAIATPPGRGGLGVVRLSGPAACAIGRTLVGRTAPLSPRHATFARILGPDAGDGRRAVDQVVVTWFAAPHSFTGDDVVEISAHGSPILLRTIVEMAMQAGARLAEPGEFTLRAYLNGKIDLVQAEAVADLVDAVTPLQARTAMDQLEGTLTAAIGRVDAALFDLAARLEASLDFPDEGFHFVTRETAAGEIADVSAQLDALARQGRTGRLVRDGCLVVIVGRPNVGKSSLFNALAGAERAIVTDVPGTTRDALTERVDIGGIPVTLVDTAGLRDARDAIEAEGVERARQARRIAALSVVVLDRAEPLTRADRAVLKEAAPPRVLVANKADRPLAWSPAESALNGEPVLDVSARTGQGLDALRQTVVVALTGHEDLRDPPALCNVRHLERVEAARAALERAAAIAREGGTEELVLEEIGDARRALEDITGRRTPDDLLRHIFSRFCIGK
jgi:tRNA modification GTPase